MSIRERACREPAAAPPARASTPAQGAPDKGAWLRRATRAIGARPSGFVREP